MARPAKNSLGILSALRAVKPAALLLVGVGACFGACSFNLNPDVLDLVETGTPIDATTQQFLPWLLQDIRPLVDKAGTPWIAAPMVVQSTFDEPAVQDGLLGEIALIELAPPYTRYLVDSKVSVFSPSPGQSICSYRPGDSDPWLLSFRRPDESVVAEVATGPLEPQLFCGQRTLAFWQPSDDNAYIDILRRSDDGSVTHSQIPWPDGARLDMQQGPSSFDDSEQVLFVTDSDYRTLAFYLDSSEVLDLGVLYWGQSRDGRYVTIDINGFLHVFYVAERVVQDIGFRLGPDGQILGIDEMTQEIITCDWDGLRAVKMPTPTQKPPLPVIAPQRILDPTPCAANSSTLPALTSLLTYTPAPVDNAQPGSELRAVRLDSPPGTPPKVLLRSVGERVLGICQDRAVAYALDSPDLYGPSVSDGWFGSYQFMERGRDLRFAPDCSRAYFKEDAANVRKLGELRSTAVPSDSSVDPDTLPPPQLLSHNVGFTSVLPDGELLAVVDLGVVGPQNRMLLIDDTAATTATTGQAQAQAIVRSVDAVTGALFFGQLLPGRHELLLEVKDTDPGRQSGLLPLTLPAKAE